MMLNNEKKDLLGSRYQLLQQMGRGGMGAVYQAQDRLTNRIVALKRVMSPDQADAAATIDLLSEQGRVALAHEFQTLASMHHPHIIQVLDYGFDSEKQPYFTMTLIDEPRTVVQAAKGQPLQAKIRILIQVLEALAYLHRRGIIHRDLKPDNALVTRDGDVKVLDFGLAMFQESQPNSENVSGTLAYIAPEVLAGHPASPASDFYALGMMTYEILAGRHPYAGRDTRQLIYTIMNESIDPTDIDADQSLIDILDRLLRKSPDERYDNAHDIIVDLSEALDQPVPQETVAIRDSYLQAARFVGRDNEMALLTNALEQIINVGKGSAWLIGGESGVGKSRLLDELRTQALVKGMLVTQGQGVEGGGMAYQLWREAVRHLLLATDIDDIDASILQEIIHDIDEVLTRQIPAAVPVEGKENKERLIGTIVSLFKKHAQPTLLILQDVQWTVESLDVLKAINQIVQDLPLCIVASYRTDEKPELPQELPEMRHIALDRLGSEEIADLSESMLGEAGRQPDILELLQRETEGNAFFLVEVMRALAEEAGRLNQIGRYALPEQVLAGGIEEVLQRRLNLVPEYAQPLLGVVAVMGRELDLRVIEKIAPEMNIEDWLADCANSAVLELKDGQWHFTHDKLRQSILKRLEDQPRRANHRQIAEAIEAIYPNMPDYAATLAHHWHGAGDELNERIYAHKAGEYALHISTFAEAVSQFGRALDLIDTTTTDDAERRTLRINLLMKLGEALLYLGEYRDAIDKLEESLLLLQSEEAGLRTAQVFNLLGDIYWRQNDYERANQYAQDGLTLGREINAQDKVADALNRLGMVAFDQGEYAEATKHFEESLSICRIAESREEQSAVLNNLGIIALTLGEHDKARERFLEMLEICRASGERRKVASGLLNLGMIAGIQGDMSDAIVDFKEALEIYRTIGERRGIALALDNLGYASTLLDQYDEAMGYFEESLALARAIGDRHRIANILLNMGHTAKDRGEKSRAYEFYRQSLTQAQEINDNPTMMEILIGLAEIADDPQTAVHWLGLVHNHTATSQATRDLIPPILEEMKSQLSSEELDAWFQHGQSLELAEVIDSVLDA